LQELSATVTVAMPTVIRRLAGYLMENDRQPPKIRLLLYVGEHLLVDQRSLLGAAFPNAQAGPLCYVLVDGGILGIPVQSPGTETQETVPTYTANAPNVMLEIISDIGEVVTDPGQRGQVVVTNLIRRLMPVIRHPMSDIAE
jgi:phenylacetate-CoA ligase